MAQYIHPCLCWNGGISGPRSGQPIWLPTEHAPSKMDECESTLDGYALAVADCSLFRKGQGRREALPQRRARPVRARRAVSWSIAFRGLALGSLFEDYSCHLRLLYVLIWLKGAVHSNQMTVWCPRYKWRGPYNAIHTLLDPARMYRYGTTSTVYTSVRDYADINLISPSTLAVFFVLPRRNCVGQGVIY